jgi:hypothetical protein
MDIESGAGEPATLDSAFWLALFRAIVQERSVEVRSVGNKLTVAAIARLVAAGGVNRVVVAMDRDFDSRRSRTISHPNVLYTFGYSWENDVFNEQIAMSIVRDVAPPQAAFAAAQTQMKAAREEALRCFSKVVRLDHTLAVNGEEVTARSALEDSIRLHEVNVPMVDRSGIAAEIRRCRASRANARLGPVGCASVQADLHGHTLARWWLAQVHHFLRTHTSTKMSKDLIARLSIAAYVRSSQTPSQNFYRSQLGQIEW